MDHIDVEINSLPCSNKQFEDYLHNDYVYDPHCTLDRGILRGTSVIVFVQDFFTNGRGLIFYVLGRYNQTKIWHGMSGMQPYDGPLNAAVITTNGWESMVDAMGKDGQNLEVEVSHGVLEGAKWKYLFETARVAWSKLIIDPRRVRLIRARDEKEMEIIRKRRTAACD